MSPLDQNIMFSPVYRYILKILHYYSQIFDQRLLDIGSTIHHIWLMKKSPTIDAPPPPPPLTNYTHIVPAWKTCTSWSGVHLPRPPLTKYTHTYTHTGRTCLEDLHWGGVKLCTSVPMICEHDSSLPNTSTICCMEETRVASNTELTLKAGQYLTSLPGRFFSYCTWWQGYRNDVTSHLCGHVQKLWVMYCSVTLHNYLHGALQQGAVLFPHCAHASIEILCVCG